MTIDTEEGDWRMNLKEAGKSANLSSGNSWSPRAHKVWAKFKINTIVWKINKNEKSFESWS